MTAPRRNHGSEQRLISFDAYCASTAADAETFCGDRDLGVTDDTLTIAEEFASNLTLEETKDVMLPPLRHNLSSCAVITDFRKRAPHARDGPQLP